MGEKFEEIFFEILYVVVALFAHKKLTYEFSVPKYAILSLGASILLTVAIVKLLRKRGKFEINLGHIFFLGMALSAILSSLNVYRNRPFYFRYSIDIALYTLLNAFVAVYITNKFKEKEKITRFLLVMIATAGFISFDALLNFYTGKDVFLGTVGKAFNRTTIKGLVGNTIFVANYLGMVIPTTIYFILSYDFGRKVGSYLKVALSKILATVSLVLMIITVIVSQTRSEYGGVFLTNLFFFVFYFYYLRIKGGKDRAKEELAKREPELAKKLSSLQRILVILTAILVVVVLVVYNLPTPLTGYGEFSVVRRVEAIASRGSWDERILAWLSSVYQWKDHKIFGTGIGTYQILTISYMGDVIKEHPRFIYSWNNFKRTHNDYFQVLGEMGIVGFLFMMSLLVYLVVYLFRTLKRIEDRDDALLFIALAMGFADFAIQSFFSFPGHLLPNALGAIFLASSALSRHFNKDGWMSFELKASKAVSAVLIFSLILTYFSTYMRWNYFVSEVYFKAGNKDYMTYIKIREDEGKAKSNLRDLKNMLKELENLQGRFAYLKPESYSKIKKKEMESRGMKVSDVEIEKMRLEEIGKLRNEIQKNISNTEAVIKKIPDLRRKYYDRALSNFEKCLNLNHAYGKAYFYLASLAIQPERISDLERSIGKLEDLKEFLDQNFDKIQKFIHPDKKRTDLKVLDELFKKFDDPWSAVNELGKTTIIFFQSFLDAISLYETSLLVFNERNTYKAIAGRFSNLHQAGKTLLARLNALAKSHPEVEQTVKMVEKSLKDRTIEYFKDFVQYAKTTIYNLPGSWNRFPDWKHYDVRRAVKGQDIYRYFANRAVEIQPIYIRPNYDFLEWLAQKEIWACEKMDAVGVWGVPDMIMDFMHAIALIYTHSNMKGSGLKLMKRDIEMYENTFYRISSQMERWKEKARSEMERKIESFNAFLDAKLVDMDENRREYLKTKIKEEFEKAFEGFEKTDWLDLVADEMRRFVSNKAYTYRRNPWNDVLQKVYQDAALMVFKMTGSRKKGDEVYKTVSSMVSPGPSMYIYERYLRFKAHYRLMLNDALDFLRQAESVIRNNDEEQLKLLKSDPFFKESFESVEDLRAYVKELRDKIIKLLEEF